MSLDPTHSSHIPYFLSLSIFSGLLLGDRGYACRTFFITPYPDPQEGSKTRFNLALNRTRVTIEQTFGILKGPFRCLEGLRVAPQRVGKIVAASVVLHNIATIRKERLPRPTTTSRCGGPHGTGLHKWESCQGGYYTAIFQLKYYKIKSDAFCFLSFLFNSAYFFSVSFCTVGKGLFGSE